MSIQIVKATLALCFLLTSFTLAADSHTKKPSRPKAKAWSSLPLIIPVKGRSRINAKLRPVNFSAEAVSVYPSVEAKNKGKSWQAPLEKGVALVRAKHQGGYHWVSGSGKQQGMTVFANTIHYFSNPGPAPREMLISNKTELEIQPLKLPREHGRFLANESWVFQVLFQNKPLADIDIAFESSNGTKTSFKTDSDGIAQIAFPDDFPKTEIKQEKQDHKNHKPQKAAQMNHSRKKANFVLAVNHDNKLATFNYSYSPDFYADKSQAMGITFLLLGMLAALPLVIRKKGAKS